MNRVMLFFEIGRRELIDLFEFHAHTFLSYFQPLDLKIRFLLFTEKREIQIR
jgi:hypothetical protein